MNNNCWVLTDSRIGNNNQAIALAHALKIKYQIITLEYNLLAQLPNQILPASFIHLNSSQQIKKDLIERPPNIVISTGRKTALVALAIKRLNPKVKLIQLLRPNCSPDKFDLIILPKHDNYSLKDNIIKTVGAINNIEERIKIDLPKVKEHYPILSNYPYMVVLVGGDTKCFNFSSASANKFFCKLRQLSENNLASLFISFSRRTPKVLKESLMRLKDEGHYVYDPMVGGVNPYPAVLSEAKFVIATADSISMCSEVISTGKPLYIYLPKEFKSKKHQLFSYQLFDVEVAKILNEETEFLQEYNYQPFNEALKVADYIQANILCDK